MLQEVPSDEAPTPVNDVDERNRDVSPVLDPRLRPTDAVEVVDRGVAPDEAQAVDFSDAETGILDIRGNVARGEGEGLSDEEAARIARTLPKERVNRP